MTFASFVVLAALFAVPAAQAAETCSQMGTVSLFWGTTAQTNVTATPIGWSTSASAPNDASGHGILAVRASTSPTLWGAFSCVEIGGVDPRAGGGTTSGPPGGTGGNPGGAGGNPGGAGGNPGGGNAGGGGAGTGGGNSVVNFFGAIGDSASNLCLTANFANLNNMTITRAACIQPLDAVPDPTQAWQWSAFEDRHMLEPSVLDALAFIGTQAVSVLDTGTTTNYVPTLVGTGVGAYVALKEDVGGLDPANAATDSGLLISFTPAA
ncbi:hypothetical protein GGX14DRAFT_633625 [Mycena pura]|uniref:Uncharacterized protein n=1 Tax=Mycena pura TaxID=153505 RepID=A0AAD6VG38_9AGAR|nr:hypothetical protein GGX14DRAFT_633625 [Mycena pura]